MEGVRQYLLSLIAAALICGIVHALIGSKNTYGSIIHLITGAVMVITLLSPIRSFQIPELSSFTDSFADEAELHVSAGTSASYQARSAIIKSQTEAYILDKASAIGVDVQVQVTVSNEADLRPVSVTLQGAVSPYAKQLLENQIETQLGIAKENQQWI